MLAPDEVRRNGHRQEHAVVSQRQYTRSATLRCQAIQGNLRGRFLYVRILRHINEAKTARTTCAILENVFFIALTASAVTEVIHDQLLARGFESNRTSRPSERLPDRFDELVIADWQSFRASLSRRNRLCHDRRHPVVCGESQARTCQWRAAKSLKSSIAGKTFFSLTLFLFGRRIGRSVCLPRQLPWPRFELRTESAAI